MNKFTGLLKQFSMVTCLLAVPAFGAVEVEEFFSKSAAVRRNAIEHADEVGPNQIALHRRLMEEPQCADRNEILIALLKIDNRMRSDLANRLLISDIPRPVVPALIEALRKQTGIARYNATFVSVIRDGERHDALKAAFALNIVARAKPELDSATALYDLLPTLSDDRARSIMDEMFHWDQMPRPDSLGKALLTLSEVARPAGIREEAAVLRIRFLEDHAGAATQLLTSLPLDNRSVSDVATMKALVGTPRLSAEDLPLVEYLQTAEGKSYLSAVLAWRAIRQSFVTPGLDLSRVRWIEIFSLFEDMDMDQATAEILLNDVALFLRRQSQGGVLATREVTEQFKTGPGVEYLSRLRGRVGAECALGVVTDPSVPLLPAPFLQAVLL